MKRIILILALFICSEKIFAQIPASGYSVNTTMGPYHGTWKWTNGIDELTIYLVTKKVYFHAGERAFYADCLVGWHIYKKAGVVIESSYGSINNVESRTIRLNNEDEPPGVVRGTFEDITKNKSCELSLKLNAAQNELIWKLAATPGFNITTADDPIYQPGFTLPKHLILIKQ